MNTTTPMIDAMEDNIRFLAELEQAADIEPGSLLDAWISGVNGNNATVTDSWAEYIADGYVDEAGVPLAACRT
jgi:hypothetical protein